MSINVIPGPVPPYANVPIHPEFYQPRVFEISAVVLGSTTLVTTTVDNDYVIGQLVRLVIPPSFGCRQLNGQSGYVLSIPAANQVEVSINSTQNVDPYVASIATTRAQILAIGDISNGIISSTGASLPSTNVPGAFINISPR